MRTTSDRRAPRLLVALGCTFALILSARAEEVDLAWIDRDALEAREIVLETSRSGGGQPVDIKAAALIDASRNAVWEILTACEQAPQYVPTIVSCELLETLDDGRTQIFAQSVRSVFFLPPFQHVFRLEYDPQRRVHIHRVSGPLEHLEGTWHLLPWSGDALLLVHELAVEMGGPVPRFLVRARLRREMQQLLRAIRERSQAATDAQPE